MPSCVTRKASAKTSKAAPLSSLDSKAEILASSSLNEFTAYKPWATNLSVRGCLGTSFFMRECKRVFLYTVELVFGVCLLNFSALLPEHRWQGGRKSAVASEAAEQPESRGDIIVQSG